MQQSTLMECVSRVKGTSIESRGTGVCVFRVALIGLCFVGGGNMEDAPSAARVYYSNVEQILVVDMPAGLNIRSIFLLLLFTSPFLAFAKPLTLSAPSSLSLFSLESQPCSPRLPSPYVLRAPAFLSTCDPPTPEERSCYRERDSATCNNELPSNR